MKKIREILFFAISLITAKTTASPEIIPKIIMGKKTKRPEPAITGALRAKVMSLAGELPEPSFPISKTPARIPPAPIRIRRRLSKS